MQAAGATAAVEGALLDTAGWTQVRPESGERGAHGQRGVPAHGVPLLLPLVLDCESPSTWTLGKTS